jgi:eukaryotic-like serine/threonine-protein kinase
VGDNRSFGRYDLLLEVSQGGMATLYLARLRGVDDFEKVVAVKKIHDHLARQPDFVAMFRDEARIASRIAHPNVAAIFDLGRVEHSYFIAMEYVHGQNLAELLRETARRKKRMGWQYAARLIADAAAGLHAAHELKNADGDPLNVVHRDVSPQNLILSSDGHLKVVDFGVAYAAERVTHTTDGSVKGKAAYMSPEQVEGERVDRRSDIFALGTVLYESVCLRRLFKADTHTATMLKVRAAKVPRLTDVVPEVPPELDRIVHKALARNPADRFATAQQLEESLHKLLVAEGKVVTPNGLAQLLNKLFHDRLDLKAEQLKHALQSQSSQVMKGVGANWDPDSSTGFDRADAGVVSADASVVSKGGARRWWLLGGGGALVAALVAVLVVMISGGRPAPGQDKAPATNPTATNPTATSPTTTPRPRSGEPRPRPRTPAKSTVTIQIEIKPADAPVVVTFRDKKVKGTNFAAVIKRSNKADTIEISAKGYVARTLVVVPSQDTRLELTLKKSRAGPQPHVRRPMVYHLEDLPK